MFCPKCGNPDQSPETYCRKCGKFLADPDKLPRKQITPAEHVTANIVLSAMTVVISFTFAFLLLYFDYGWPEASVLTYATVGFLIAIGCWNIQTFYRSLLLRKYFKGNKVMSEQASNYEVLIERADTNKALNEADFEHFEPASVTDRTTRQLVDDKRRSS
jgi:hypothetical protein